MNIPSFMHLGEACRCHNPMLEAILQMHAVLDMFIVDAYYYKRGRNYRVWVI